MGKDADEDAFLDALDSPMPLFTGASWMAECECRICHQGVSNRGGNLARKSHEKMHLRRREKIERTYPLPCLCGRKFRTAERLDLHIACFHPLWHPEMKAAIRRGDLRAAERLR